MTSSEPPRPQEARNTLPKVFYGWWLVSGASILNAVTGGVYFFGFSAFFLPLTKEFDASYGTVSTIFGLANLVQSGILAPILGMLIDRIGPRRIMFVGVTILGLGYVLISFAPNIVLFYIFFLLLAAPGITMGTQWPLSAAVANWFERKRGRAFGIVNAGFGMGAVVVMLTNFLIESLDWRGAAFAIGISLWAIGYPIAAFVRRRPEDHDMKPDGRRGSLDPIDSPASPKSMVEAPPMANDGFTLSQALLAPAFWLLFLSFSLRTGVSLGTAFHIFPAMEDKGYSSDIAAAVVTGFGVTSIPFRLIAATMLDYFERRYVAAFLSLILGLATFVFSWADSAWELVLFVVLFAIGSGGTAGLLQPIGAAYFGRKAYATIMGYGSAITVLGMASFPTIGGFMRDASGNYDSTLYTFSGIAVVATALMMLAKEPRQPTK